MLRQKWSGNITAFRFSLYLWFIHRWNLAQQQSFLSVLRSHIRSKETLKTYFCAKTLESVTRRYATTAKETKV